MNATTAKVENSKDTIEIEGNIGLLDSLIFWDAAIAAKERGWTGKKVHITVRLLEEPQVKWIPWGPHLVPECPREPGIPMVWTAIGWCCSCGAVRRIPKVRPVSSTSPPEAVKDGES